MKTEKEMERQKIKALQAEVKKLLEEIEKDINSGIAATPAEREEAWKKYLPVLMRVIACNKEQARHLTSEQAELASTVGAFESVSTVNTWQHKKPAGCFDIGHLAKLRGANKRLTVMMALQQETNLSKVLERLVETVNPHQLSKEFIQRVRTEITSSNPHRLQDLCSIEVFPWPKEKARKLAILSHEMRALEKEGRTLYELLDEWFKGIAEDLTDDQKTKVAHTILTMKEDKGVTEALALPKEEFDKLYLYSRYALEYARHIALKDKQLMTLESQLSTGPTVEEQYKSALPSHIKKSMR